MIPTACVSNLGSTVTGTSESIKSAYQSKVLMCLDHYASYTGLCACSADCLVALNVLHIPKPHLKSQADMLIAQTTGHFIEQNSSLGLASQIQPNPQILSIKPVIVQILDQNNILFKNYIILLYYPL